MADEDQRILKEPTATYRAGGKLARKAKKARGWDSPTPTIAALAKAQGIKPWTDKVLEKADFWPEDQDVVEFIGLAKGKRDPLE